MFKLNVMRALWFAAAGATTACSTPHGALPIQPNAAPEAYAGGSLLVKIRVPHAPATHRVRVSIHGRPAYISAATKGMTISVSGPTNVSETLGLTPGSPNCSGSTCTIAISGLRACGKTNCYTAAVATYDNVTCTTTCSIPTGAQELSSETGATFTISTGTSNLVTLTLDGRPVHISIPALSPGYLQGSAAALTLWGANSEQLPVVVTDADGYTIVGPGSPVVSGSTTSAALAVTSTPNAPGQVTLRAVTAGTPPIVTPGTASVTLTATPVAGGGAPVALTVPVTIAHSAVYATQYLSTADYLIVYYDGNVSATPNVRITLTDGPQGVAVDQNGTIYVAGFANEILEYSASANGNAAPAATIVGSKTLLNNPQQLTYEPNAHLLWVANNGSDPTSIAAFSTSSSGNVAPVTLIEGSAATLGGPLQAAVDAEGTIHVADNSSRILSFGNGANGNVAPLSILSGAATGLSRPASIAIANGSLFAANDVETASLLNVFPTSASGDAASAGSLQSPGGPSLTESSVAVDASESIWISNDTAIYEFARGATGAASPIATIPLSATAIAVVPAAAP
jgi:hypothetical protein